MPRNADLIKRLLIKLSWYIVKPENILHFKEQQFREYTRSLARFPNLANVKLIVGFTIKHEKTEKLCHNL